VGWGQKFKEPLKKEGGKKSYLNVGVCQENLRVKSGKKNCWVKRGNFGRSGGGVQRHTCLKKNVGCREKEFIWGEPGVLPEFNVRRNS